MALQRHAELAFGTEGAACSWNLEKKHERKVTTRKVSQELGTVANPNHLPKLESDDARLLQVDSGVGLGVSDLCVSYGLSCEQGGKCESWGNPWLGSDDAGGS